MDKYFLFDIRRSTACFTTVLVFCFLNISLMGLATFAIVGSAACALRLVLNY